MRYESQIPVYPCSFRFSLITIPLNTSKSCHYCPTPFHSIKLPSLSYFVHTEPRGKDIVLR
ncbi:hypothetical protein CIPAW_01G016300 [Carya illinoinensis]|uniref:Uncharacterized protein n=1 Tax=Carya illinoinensis TaxID=32201 RepID=A0A8T1RGZ7_CARIL|nr:hypothetical protein CIPAW_01G016300 [Carya illinoinensis]